MTTWILWFVITISQNHLGHFPVDGYFQTQEECARAGALMLPTLLEQFPDDPAVRTYCEPHEEGL